MMNNGIQEMAIDARDVLTGAEWFVAAGTLMTALVVGVRKVYRLARNVEESLDTVNKVSKQLEPNGGYSLYDKIAQLTDHVHANAERAKAVDEKVDDLSVRIRRLESYHMDKTEKQEP